ncbi:MAG TPA: MauE/DoxX family redox-associated membrane protein [Chlamydiales bacterium]|nr:MauE/DoxX family redox-associated membrane protein [Chlamydiales bacterium]
MKAYGPLISLIVIAALAAFAVMHGILGNWFQWMHYFMGFFFCQFAMLKLFHPEGFAEGFQMYDLIAMRFRSYGYIYPFIELLLGLAYLSYVFPLFIYAVTIIVSLIGAIGVLKALKKGLDLRCACMGTALDVPLSTVTLTEDIAMGIMALFMFIGAI